MAVYGSNLYIGGVGGFYRSTDGGSSWAYSTQSIDEITALLALSDTNIFAGTQTLGMYRSNSNGMNWMPIDSGLSRPYGKEIQCLASSGTYLFAGTQAGVFRSSDNGTSWTKAVAGLNDTNVNALAFSGSNIFAGTTGGVFLSTNSGTSWAAVDSGLTNSYVTALAVSGSNIFAGTYGSGVWRRPLSEMITTVHEAAEIGLPKRFSLEQNYPNPFNPTTTISYQLAAVSHVTSKVYDILGREVATLVKGIQSEGEHSTKFDGSKFSSGVYLYRLDAVKSDGGSFTDTKRMVMIK
jgi:hypothetical protein